VLFFGAHLSSIPSVKPKVMSVEKMHQSLTHEQGTKKKSESPTRSSQSVHRDETSKLESAMPRIIAPQVSQGSSSVFKASDRCGIHGFELPSGTHFFFFQIFLSHMHFHDKQQKQNGVAEKGSSERKVKILVN